VAWQLSEQQIEHAVRLYREVERLAAQWRRNCMAGKRIDTLIGFCRWPWIERQTVDSVYVTLAQLPMRVRALKDGKLLNVGSAEDCQPAALLLARLE
jgi:hypothetical protein